MSSKDYSATVRMLSDYQIVELGEMFRIGYIIEKIGRIDETGALYIQYRGGPGWDAIMKTKLIEYTPKPTEPNKSKEK